MTTSEIKKEKRHKKEGTFSVKGTDDVKRSRERRELNSEDD